MIRTGYWFLGAWLGVLLLGGTPAMADEPKEGETVIHGVDFPIKAASGKTYACRKAEFGSYQRVNGELVYHLGIVDYTCDSAQRTFQIICRVSWGPQESTPPSRIESADGVGVIQIFTLDPDVPDSLRAGGGTEDLKAVTPAKIDEVARTFLKDKCLARIPVPATP